MSKARTTLRLILFILALGVFAFSAYMLISYRVDEQRSTDVTSDAKAAAVAQRTPSPTTSENEATYSNNVQSENKEYAPISVDFSALFEQNGDIVGYIYSPDTPIDMPIVQSEDNDYYLHRLLNGETNRAGSIFMDYRSTPNFSDVNTIIYGHNMKSGAMFGTIDEYKSQQYYEEHPTLYILTPSANYKAEAMVGAVVQSDCALYDLSLSEEEMYAEIVRAVADSSFTATVQPQAGDRFVTLSTCSYEFDDARYVLICRLTEIG